MNIKEKIKQSGLRYFRKRSPAIDIGEVISFRKPKNVLPSWMIGTIGLTSIVSFFIVVTLTLQSTQPLSSIERDFVGLTNLNQVTFPDPLNRVEVQEDLLTPFALETSSLLWEKDSENVVYSPLSLYLALAMVLEASSGNTYEEISDVLGVNSLEDIRVAMQDYYQHYYQDEYDETQLLSRLRLHQAMFFQHDFPIDETYLQTLSEYYYAELFATDFAENAHVGIADWVNERTYDFLNVLPEDLGVSPESKMALYQTYYLKSNWKIPFDGSMNYEAAFNEGNSQQKNNQTYLKKVVSDSPLWLHDQFTLVGDRSYGKQTVYYLTPTRQQSLNEIWQTYQQDIVAFAQSPILQDFYLHIPKTKVMSKVSLKPLLQALGILEAFTDQADFSKANPSLFLESVQQQAGFALNEDGVEASAYTEMDFETTSMPNPTLDIRINQSFILLIVSEEGALSLMANVQQLS